MTTELRLLGAVVILGLVHLVWSSVAARRQQSWKWAGGPRDEPRPVTGRAARLERAFRNFLETFPLFAAALLAAHVGEKTGALTLCGSVLYAGGRALFLPLYVFHAGLLRSLVWFVSMAGLLLVVGALIV